MEDALKAPVGVWENEHGEFASGMQYRIGKVIVGGTFYDSMRPRGDTKPYGYDCRLPDIKRTNERYETEAEARRRVEEIITAWFLWIGDTD